MKRSLLAIALVTGFMFIAVSAFANPAMLKKQHDGYPNQGKGTTGSGEAAELKAAEDAPKTLKEQLQAESKDRAGNVITDDSRQRTHPGYPTAGVVENHIKGATKVNADPK